MMTKQNLLSKNRVLSLMFGVMGVAFSSTAYADEKGIMPQMEVLTFPSQIFWMLVTFAALYMGVSKLFLPKVETIFTQRQQHIRNDVEVAKKMASEAEEIETTIENEQKVIHDKARKVLKAAQVESSKDLAEKSRVIHGNAQVKFAKIEKEVKASKKAYLLKVDEVAISLCHDILEKISGEVFDPKEVEKEILTHKKEQELRVA